MAKINFYTRYAVFISCVILFSSCQVHIKKPNKVIVIEDSTRIDVSDVNEPEVITDDLQEVDQEPKALRKKVAATYTKEIGVRERTGKNDGTDVEKYLKAVGLGKGYAWCAAFVRWVFDVCGVKTTITAWSPTAENRKKIRYRKGKTYGPGPQQADVITLYYSSKGRIGHTGFFDYMVNQSIQASVEGNTDRSNSNEGDGVYLVFRPMKTIHSISSWID